MKKIRLWKGCLALLLLTTSCTTHYQVADVKGSRVIVDKRYDAALDQEALTFLAPYKQQVDSVMGPVVGVVACDMVADRPESKLSNLLADILVWAGKFYNEQPVLGVYNMGGIRAALTKGEVTYGDVLDVAPFENKICFITLSGAKLLELFQQMAQTGGEGVSKGVEMVITKDHQLVSVRLHGKEIDPAASYRVTTIDYLLQGNDKLTAFRDGTDIVSPTEDSNNSRYIIINYFKEKQKMGEVVDAKIEGRIVVR